MRLAVVPAQGIRCNAFGWLWQYASDSTWSVANPTPHVPSWPGAGFHGLHRSPSDSTSALASAPGASIGAVLDGAAPAQLDTAMATVAARPPRTVIHGRLRPPV